MKNIIFPTNLENTNINTLINNNLKMSIDDFKKLNLLKINLNVDINKYKNEEYLHFCIACVFIINELNKIKNFKKYNKGYYTDFIRDIQVNNNFKSYKNCGYKKYLTCRLVNCNSIIINNIPKKLLDIDIITVPLYNKHIKMEFQLGTIKLDNNELTIVDKSKTRSSGILSFLYNLLSPTTDIYTITYTGNIEDEHIIEFDNESIIYNVRETNKNILTQSKIIKKDINIPKYNFNYILYNKIYE